MKRAVFLYSFALICLLAGGAAFGQSNAKSDAKSDAKKSCPFSIVGLWRSDVTAQTNSIFFDFSPEGYVTLMGHSAGTLPQDFEMIESVNYKLDKPSAPRHIEFMATRGNDAFPQGITPMDIVEYSDDSFTTKDLASGQKTQWTREQTRRYFLTFAARSGQSTAFALWTVMDGRETKVEALGVQLTKDDKGNSLPVFGAIPAELYTPIIEVGEKDKKANKESKDESVFMRFELTQAEFDTTHETYQAWEKYVKDIALPHADPYLNGMEFFSKVAEGLNQCGEKANLRRPSQRERDEIVSKYAPPQRMLEYTKMMKKNNDELHVNNAVFPWSWRPVVQMHGQ